MRKQQQNLKICTKCSEAKYESEFQNPDWDKPDYTRCMECRKEDKAEYMRRYRNKKKAKMNLDTNRFVTQLMYTHVVEQLGCPCARCGYDGYPCSIRLIDPHGDVDFNDDISTYIYTPDESGWAQILKVIPFLIPICLNCIAQYESGLFNLLDLKHQYTESQLNLKMPRM